MKMTKKILGREILASIVVFLVALPLCLGIAIASGVPPILGLISGIIGGLVVGSFAGAPLQVSGPAAGLAVMVFEFVDRYGLEALAPLGIVVGLLQILAWRYQLADYFKAISPALIKGLLSGIGLLILASQFHVAVDAMPVGGGLKNLLHIPNSFLDFVVLEGGGRSAFFLALMTLGSIFIWQQIEKKFSLGIPAPLVAIALVSGVAYFFQPEVKLVVIADNIAQELNMISWSHRHLFSFAFLGSCLAIAFVASAETLLSVTAVDKLSGKGQSDYNKEMLAQGLGNAVAGVFGALPITGVIVRSSANIESGASTRYSAIIHGIWLFVLVFFFASFLSLIPMSALAAILIYTGWKLLNIKQIPEIIQKSKGEALVYFVTFILISCVDLLTGVIVGFMTSVAFLVYELQNLQVSTEETESESRVVFSGTASFLQVPKISSVLRKVSKEKDAVIDIRDLKYQDWAVQEQFQHWKELHLQTGFHAKIHDSKN
ncbi:MAG: SulP family inorganic anion transporter [Bdellovibrionales bacterium]|nr:SulP family inorganic anion transporter [Bdellovibrionales bacterium]